MASKSTITPHPPHVATSNMPREGFLHNETVFGAILRGELPATVLYEDADVLCFKDIRPVSDHHTLVIPKRWIADSNHLVAQDADLVRHMMDVAKRVLAEERPDVNIDAALATGSISLGFHRWPAISVHHLHLHCIYPMPCPFWWHRWLHPKEYGPFYLSGMSVLENLSTRAASMTN